MTVANVDHVPEAAANLVALLADEGVSHLFINPGIDSAPLQEALAAARAAGTPTPKAVLCVHESVALSAAIGHHMISRRPQAVMVHVDAGTLNLGCQIHNAQRNRTPVVVLAGRAPYTAAPDVRGHRDSQSTGSKSNSTSKPSCGPMANGIWKCRAAVSWPPLCAGRFRSPSPAPPDLPTSCCPAKR